MSKNQFTQDYSPIGFMVQEFCKKTYGDIKMIEPYYTQNFDPLSINDAEQNEIVFLVEGGFESVNLEIQSSFDLHVDNINSYLVRGEITQYAPPDTFYKELTIIHDRFIRAVRNLVNIEFTYGYGYLVTFKDNIFDVIP